MSPQCAIIILTGKLGLLSYTHESCESMQNIHNLHNVWAPFELFDNIATGISSYWNSSCIMQLTKKGLSYYIKKHIHSMFISMHVLHNAWTNDVKIEFSSKKILHSTTKIKNPVMLSFQKYLIFSSLHVCSFVLRKTFRYMQKMDNKR